MKKYLCFFIGLFLCSCSYDEAEYKAYVKREFAENIVEIEYKGHTYLRYHTGGGNCSVGGICHSASCHCYTDKNSK